MPVRPVKGQVLRLRDPRGPGLVERTVRTRDAYLVPRADGRYVLGATMEERGWDTAPTAGGVFELLRDVSEVVPGVLELELEELLAGPAPGDARQPAGDRPGALDGGSSWATGHHRNGILLAGLTGELAAAALCGEPLPDWAAAGRPRAASRGCRHDDPAQRRGARARARARRCARCSTRSTSPGGARGVAVAVDAEVVPRGEWETTELDDGARVEVLRAIQGG